MRAAWVLVTVTSMGCDPRANDLSPAPDADIQLEEPCAVNCPIADGESPTSDAAQRVDGATDAGAITLWNGGDLSAFDCDDWLWHVEDGAIVGRAAVGQVPENRFLIYRHEVSDFELTGEMWVGAGGNSGVQYRSLVVDAEQHIVAGYQADMGPGGACGMLYDERGTRDVIVATNPACGAAAADQWHSFQIRAQGFELVHWVDGVECIRYHDEHPLRASSGVLAFQYHSPGGYDVRYRNLLLTRL